MALTPMMQQYLQIKENHKDCIIFFRLGDFYEMFFEDAVVASKELELVLTGRDCGLEERAPMCGIPYHAANSYISRLVSRGYKIGICEQLEDPSAAKGIVRRDIIKIVTPGTYTDSAFLEDSRNVYIMSLFINSLEHEMALCFADISTGEFTCTSSKLDTSVILDEIAKFNPAEIILQENIAEDILLNIKERFNSLISKRNDAFFCDEAENNLRKQFTDLDFAVLNTNQIYSCSGLLSYILETQKLALSNINKIDVYDVIDYLNIDTNSRRNLELTETLRDKNKKGSLLWVLDKTNTAMGAREIRKWIDQPLINREKIQNRLDSIEELLKKPVLRADLSDALKQIYDIERIIGKISSKSVNAKELISLKNSIVFLPSVKNILSSFSSGLLSNMYNSLDELSDIYKVLEDAILDSPSLSVKEGNIIKDGFNSEIDELRGAKSHGKEWIASLESKEKEVTGIKSLKVGYNKVFGYYLEVTNANLNSIPEGRYIRKQTLSNAERFITPELKEMEDKILGAEERLISLEYELFVNIRESIELHINRMKESAKILAHLDCLCSLASVALENNYCKPMIDNSNSVNISEGRHPVVEKIIPQGSFVTNDIVLNNSDEQLLLITGPNMAGKSTYMRQAALITIMAQIGSYVPAKGAHIGICDRIFTRIGASDDLSAGKSTFMVEMWEVSNIIKNATAKSLILLDEVGRGTSTYDGLSIAWAVIEYICKNNKLKSKTLFATHYHELTKLEGIIEGVKNYSVSVKEIGKEIVFLHKIVPGGADQSYGIEVAKLAGLPEELIVRAKEILLYLENEDAKEINVHADFSKPKSPKKSKPSEDLKQISLLDIEKDNFIGEVADLDILNITPLEAINKLYELAKKAKSL